MLENNNYKISIIIPVYKVEDYIHRCVESVLNQTMDDLEIILVDDGSPDNCPEICDEYAMRNDNVFTFHKKNGGLSSARNVGIKNAHGKYLFFLDSDDWLDPDGLERLYKIAEDTNVDFVRYRSYRTGWPGVAENIPTRVEEARELEGGYYSLKRIQSEILPRLFATSQLTLGPIVGAWSSLYKSAFIKENGILFDENIKYSEDIPFSAEVVLHTNSFYFVDDPGTYHYFYNKNSISKSMKRDRWASCRHILNKCEQLAAGHSEYKYQLNYLRWFCIFLALNERWNLGSLKQKQQYCAEILNDEIIKKAFVKDAELDVSSRQKLYMYLVKLRLSWVLACI